MSPSYQLDPQLGYVPAIPLPYYKFRWTRLKVSEYCWDCKKFMNSQGDWERHWVLTHLENEND